MSSSYNLLLLAAREREIILLLQLYTVEGLLSPFFTYFNSYVCRLFFGTTERGYSQEAEGRSVFLRAHLLKHNFLACGNWSAAKMKKGTRFSV